VQSDLVVRRPVTRAVVLAVDGEHARERRDELATEEPMEIRVHGPGQDPAPVAVTMRTPGSDFELAVGLCLTDGIIESQADVDTIAYCLAPDALPAGEKPEQQYNIVTVRLRRPVAADIRERRYLATSACGVCGKAALEEVEVRCAPVGKGPRVPAGVVRRLPELLAARQQVFDRTGGLHAAARFTADGELVAVREDVGRHNALDKLIGHALLEHALPLGDNVLLVSGRLSFELVQKAAIAGIPVLCGVSAPSSLAVAAAERFGQTVVGFLRDERFNVYTHRERIDLAA
jgi:FdhD protein